MLGVEQSANARAQKVKGGQELPAVVVPTGLAPTGLAPTGLKSANQSPCVARAFEPAELLTLQCKAEARLHRDAPSKKRIAARKGGS